MIYEYECACGKRKEEFRKVKDRNNPVRCECGKPMQKLIGGHRVHADIAPYYDDNLQTGIRSKQHRAQVMREQGVYEKYGKGWH